LAVSANDIQKGPYSMCPTVSSVKVLWQDASPTTVSEGVGNVFYEYDFKQP